MLLLYGGQSLSHLLVHSVFSTKDRRRFLRSEESRNEIYAYMAGILKNLECHPIKILYITNQAEHHRKFSFQEEVRELLKRHRITFDERYLWGLKSPISAAL